MLPRNWDKSLQLLRIFAERHGKISSVVSIPVYLFLGALPCLSQASPNRSGSDWDGSQVMLVLPLVMFLYGFHRIRKAKMVADIPRIPIRSVALGMVTIKGKVEPDQMVPAPVSGRPCCFFKVHIEEWDKDQKDWTPALTDYDGPRFFLADETGKVLIDAHYVEELEFKPPQTALRLVDSNLPAKAPDATAPTDAELLQYVSTKTGFQHFAATAAEAAEAWAGPAKGRYRLTESLVLPGQEYQVIGTCAENPDSRNENDRIVICQGQSESTFIISSKTGTDLTTDVSAFGWGLVGAGSLYFLIWLLFICFRG